MVTRPNTGTGPLTAAAMQAERSADKRAAPAAPSPVAVRPRAASIAAAAAALLLGPTTWSPASPSCRAPLNGRPGCVTTTASRMAVDMTASQRRPRPRPVCRLRRGCRGKWRGKQGG